MRSFILAAGLIAAALPASAETIAPATIAPAEVKAHVGQTVTVEAAVTDIHTGRAGATFINMGGSYPDNEFTAVIFASDLAKFPGAKALKGKTVAVSGPVQLYQGKPEIILKTAEQLRTN
jgi:DNA/RNA endonuclease YhcR with UshA esterase domain